MGEPLAQLAQAIAGRLFVELEASGRHVHVTAAQAQTLFGHGLTPERPLSQPGQYLAKERVTVTGPKGSFRNVAVLGPERKAAQVEISLTDGRTLGISPPVRLSGDVTGTPGVTLEGERGQVVLSQGVIAAQRHVHLIPEDAARFGVKNGQNVKLQTYNGRPVLEALAQGKSVYLYTPGLPEAPKNRALSGSLTAAQRELKNWGVLFTDGGRKKLITAEEARLLRSQGRQPAPGAVLTPLAREIMEGTK